MSNEKEFDFEEIKADPENDEEVVVEIPVYGSSEWEKYVMESFLPDELYDGNYPTLNGMRRVALNLMGNVMFSGPLEVISKLPESSYCIYNIKFESGYSFSAAADAHLENISGAFSIYPTAIAESRAEARAYRKALLLSTVSAEEVKGNENTFHSVLKESSSTTVEGYNEKDSINDQKKSIIESKCKQLKIKLDKFLENQEVSFDTATKEDGVKLAKLISDYQRGTVEIPESIK